MEQLIEKPVYTPFRGGHKPFTIAISPLDPNCWIEPDEEIGFFLSEKRRLGAEVFDTIYKAEPETDAAQREVLAELSGWLTANRPDVWQRDGSLVHVAGHTVDLEDESLPPLVRAGLLVQDDLVLMRRGEDGWRIAAAHLAFPSSWSLEDKFGRPMEQVHAEVPDFKGGTRNATIINRMFDNFKPGMPVKRYNWTINWSYELHLPATKTYAPNVEARNVAPGASFIRIERQSLARMPVSGDLLFTIRIYIDPVKAMEENPELAPAALSLADQLEGLTTEQANYKGLTEKRPELVAHLRAIAAAHEAAAAG
ncbi:DUF3445 domain-containing protein [Rhizobiaceae bacterium BDR2-2]|uniref:DUF3445 domain-containing protein n=1 Tax=Ectorhizobium quercum TaxID=2965071 RepID=A0AAE3SVW5_9HYPH|nr:DUF3445 domain-containing protein [Ectorhizobium quercum]MCX8996820.1 DUF3445 domain-containing protein [Ectorhizobium quercum]